MVMWNRIRYCDLWPLLLISALSGLLRHLTRAEIIRISRGIGSTRRHSENFANKQFSRGQITLTLAWEASLLIARLQTSFGNCMGPGIQKLHGHLNRAIKNGRHFGSGANWGLITPPINTASGTLWDPYSGD